MLINSDCFLDKGIQNERTFCTWMWRGGDSSILIKARVCFREGRQWEGEWFWNFIPSFIDSLLFRWTWNMRRTRQYGGSSCKDEHSVPWRESEVPRETFKKRTTLVLKVPSSWAMILKTIWRCPMVETGVDEEEVCLGVMRSVLGPSVWSAAQYMVILYFVRELFKFC